MNTVTVEVTDKTGTKIFKAYDANFLFDRHGFFVQISVMEKGEPKRYYFNLADCTISFHDN
jgi:hypothetical protein